MQVESVPLLSGATWLGHAREFRDDRFGFIARLGRECDDDMRRIRFGGKDMIAGNSPAFAHELLVERARSLGKAMSVRIAFQPLTGDGLFTSEGEPWQRQRRLVAPLFAPAQLAGYGASMVELAARAAARWRDGEAIDVGREMTRVTMAVVGRALFDAETFDDADALGEALAIALDWSNRHLGTVGTFAQVLAHELVGRAADRAPSILRPLLARLRRALSAPIFLRARSPRVAGALARLDATIRRMLDERRASGLTRPDLVTRLLGARDGQDPAAAMSDQQVRDEAVTLFIAGHETTATALTWAFYLLARDRASWQKVELEADRLADGEPTPARLPHTTRVFKEAMRLYPPLYMLGRRALEPVRILGRAFAEQTHFFLSPWALHRRADLYPDPDRFDPERWTPDEEARRPRSSYVPFGAGPRVCIGSHFALMEGALVLATLARRISLEIDPTRTIAPGPFATMRPATPIIAIVRKRRAA